MANFFKKIMHDYQLLIFVFAFVYLPLTLLTSRLLNVEWGYAVNSVAMLKSTGVGVSGNIALLSYMLGAKNLVPFLCTCGSIFGGFEVFDILQLGVRRRLRIDIALHHLLHLAMVFYVLHDQNPEHGPVSAALFAQETSGIVLNAHLAIPSRPMWMMKPFAWSFLAWRVILFSLFMLLHPPTHDNILFAGCIGNLVLNYAWACHPKMVAFRNTTF